MDNRIADVEVRYDNSSDGFVKELTKFANAVQGKGEVPATGEQGLVAMRLLDAIYRSSEADCEVEV